jgi:hypothetical protein
MLPMFQKSMRVSYKPPPEGAPDPFLQEGRIYDVLEVYMDKTGSSYRILREELTSPTCKRLVPHA